MKQAGHFHEAKQTTNRGEPRDVVEQPWVRSVVARVARQIREEDAMRGAAMDESRPPKTNDDDHRDRG
jgi:hypothetical protein